jgi:hypothetical protein
VLEEVWYRGLQVLILDNMLGVINPGEAIHKIAEHKKFIWVVYDYSINDSMAGIKPFFDKKHDENILEEFNKVFPDAVIYESYVQDVIDDLIGFEFDVDDWWDDKRKYFQSVIIKFDKGWVSETSRTSCFCPRTITKYIFDLYPQYIPQE